MNTDVDWRAIYDIAVERQSYNTDMFNSPNWAKISIENQMNKKFDHPIKPIPWFSDYEKNIALTLEWLVRDHRKDDLRLREEFLHQQVREFWFHNEYDRGMYMHVCYPKDLLTYRMQYDAAYTQWVNLDPRVMSSHAIDLLEYCKDSLWNRWKCIGKDGFPAEYGDLNGTIKLFPKIAEKEYCIKYRYSCSRCCMKMPKGVKMFTMLTQSKLKDV